MKHWLTLFFCAISIFPATAQPVVPGIRNAGLLGCLHPLPGESGAAPGTVYLHEKTTKVDLYPGFAVISQAYFIVNDDSLAVDANFGLPIEGFVNEPGIGRLFFTEPHAVRLSVNGQALQHQFTGPSNKEKLLPFYPGDTSAYARWYTWKLSLPPKAGIRLTIDAIVRTSLSRFSRQGESRDGNAFALRMGEDKKWSREQTKHRIMVRLREGLRLTDIWGIRPDSAVEGDFTHLRYQRTGKDDQYAHFLVWYSGAPPDFKFDKKILPFADTLYTIMETFPAAEFDRTKFEIIHRNNFSLSPSGLTISGILYFLMFTVPWILLAAIIIYLLRGGKRKEASKSLTNGK